MAVWKLQAVEPDTCEGTAQGQGCRYIELWTPDDPPATRTHTVVSFDRVCAGHAGTVVTDKLLWADGNWKDYDAYIQYQRDWFKWRNHQQWLVNHPTEPMPPQIAAFSSEPVTPGSVPAPPQAQIDAMNRVYGWNQNHNQRWGLVLSGAIQLIGAEEPAAVKFTRYWTGTGDTRVMHVAFPDLTQQQKNQLQSLADIQFGPGKVIIE